MNYDHEALLADFAKRTLHNLELIREIKSTQPHRKAFEVTQLINSLLGLLVFPKENYLEQIPDKTIEELKAEGWPIPKPQANFNQAKDLKDFLRLMRNGVAHFNLEFLSGRRNEITGIRIWNNRKGVKDWEVELTLEAIEFIALRFIELITGEKINMQDENTLITWQRALVRSGFYFQTLGETFDFSGEREANRVFLHLILAELKQSQLFNGEKFSPSVSTIDEAQWLAAVETAHGFSRGLESGTLVHNINLKDLDIYIAGVVRWLNTAGFETTHSCDGHKTHVAQLGLRERNFASLLGYFLKIVSDDEWKYAPNGHLFLRDNPPHRPNRDSESTPRTFERMWLLDVAEVLHSRQHELREFVHAAQRLKPR